MYPLLIQINKLLFSVATLVGLFQKSPLRFYVPRQSGCHSISTLDPRLCAPSFRQVYLLLDPFHERICLKTIKLLSAITLYKKKAEKCVDSWLLSILKTKNKRFFSKILSDYHDTRPLHKINCTSKINIY